MFFIIGNEVCERFSFYGLKAILALYMVNYLYFSESTATASLHAFVMVAYSLTLFGGILSDSYLGKFHTVLYLSIVYVIGGACLSVTALPGALFFLFEVASIVVVFTVGECAARAPAQVSLVLLATRNIHRTGGV